MKWGSSKAVAVVVLLLIGAEAWVLARVHQRQRMGEPGLRMVAAEVRSEKGQLINTNTVDLPASVLGYRSETRPITEIELSWLPADTLYARRIYQASDQFELMLNVVMMGQDRSSIHRPQMCLLGQGWTIEKTDALEIAVPRLAGGKLPMMRLIASRPMQTKSGSTITAKAVYCYWFVADGQVTAEHGQRMWWMARDLLTQGVLQRWAYVSCLAICLPGNEEATYQRLERFLAEAVPHFQFAPAPSPQP